MIEFFSMSEIEKIEIINNALDAGPTIPFQNFSKLFKTWLEVLSTIAEEQRFMMFSNYIKAITTSPQKIVNYNLDGILEIFISLDQSKKEILRNSLKNVIAKLDDNSKKKLFLVMPENAKKQLQI